MGSSSSLLKLYCVLLLLLLLLPVFADSPQGGVLVAPLLLPLLVELDARLVVARALGLLVEKPAERVAPEGRLAQQRGRGGRVS